MSALALMLIAGSVQVSRAGCPDVFSASAPAAAKTRASATHALASGEIVNTSDAREVELKRLENNMLDEIYARGKFAKAHSDTPPMELVPEDGVKATYVDRYDGGDPEITHVKVSGLGSKGVLRATMLMPVSGHTGVKNAEAWAKTDTYSILQGQTAIAKNVKSLDLVTKHEIEITLKKGANEIFYERSGSGGVGGYAEGRTIVVDWDGT